MDIQVSQRSLSYIFIGYKGSAGTDWRTGTNSSDWSGCYIGTSVRQSQGYFEIQNGLATIWTCSLKITPLEVVYVTGKDMASSSISSEAKAKEIKRQLNINETKLLIPTLGQQDKGYVGPDTEANKEIIIPWDIVDKYIKREKLREYNIKNYEEIGWRKPGENTWRSMSEEPTNDPVSPVNNW